MAYKLDTKTRIRNKYIYEPAGIRRICSEKYKEIDKEVYRRTKTWIPTSTYATLRSFRRTSRKGGAERTYRSINWQNNDNYDAGGRYTYKKSKIGRNRRKNYWMKKGYDYSIAKFRRDGLL